MNNQWYFPYCPEEDNWSINWLAIAPIFNDFNELFTQSKLRCENLVKSTNWQSLPKIERSLLFTAALFSDVAKINKQIFWDLNIPLWEREQIIALIKYGSLPLWFWERSNPDKLVIKVSQLVRCDMLAMLAEAEVKRCGNTQEKELLERIDFFCEFTQEYDCFQQPRQFYSDLSRFIYFQKEQGDLNYQPYDDRQLSVVLMSGLPGSGKDTWIAKNLGDYPVISLDQIRQEMGIKPTDDQGIVANYAKTMAKTYLRHQRSFVWNATNLNSQLRGMLIKLFNSYQAQIKIVYLETSWQELLHRNKTRVAKVPEKVLYRLRDRLEVPNIIEAHQVDWIIN